MKPSDDFIAKMRQEYVSKPLRIVDVADMPLVQFGHWFEEALAAKVDEPNAMALATVGQQGQPSVRTVLLKGFGEEGFLFYTNYDSRKGQELAGNPSAALLFTWLPLHRQVRIEGRVTKRRAADSAAYFESRPKGSQIGAWASPQSKPISRQALEDQVVALQAQYKEVDVLPCPPHWGGYALVPQCIEFWQGRRSRLHDRICYTKGLDGSWAIERLAP